MSDSILGQTVSEKLKEDKRTPTKSDKDLGNKLLSLIKKQKTNTVYPALEALGKTLANSKKSIVDLSEFNPKIFKEAISEINGMDDYKEGANHEDIVHLKQLVIDINDVKKIVKEYEGTPKKASRESRIRKIANLEHDLTDMKVQLDEQKQNVSDALKHTKTDFSKLKTLALKKLKTKALEAYPDKTPADIQNVINEEFDPGILVSGYKEQLHAFMRNVQQKLKNLNIISKNPSELEKYPSWSTEFLKQLDKALPDLDKMLQSYLKKNFKLNLFKTAALNEALLVKRLKNINTYLDKKDFDKVRLSVTSLLNHIEESKSKQGPKTSIDADPENILKNIDESNFSASEKKSLRNLLEKTRELLLDLDAKDKEVHVKPEDPKISDEDFKTLIEQYRRSLYHMRKTLHDDLFNFNDEIVHDPDANAISGAYSRVLSMREVPLFEKYWANYVDSHFREIDLTVAKEIIADGNDFEKVKNQMSAFKTKDGKDYINTAIWRNEILKKNPTRFNMILQAFFETCPEYQENILNYISKTDLKTLDLLRTNENPKILAEIAKNTSNKTSFYYLATHKSARVRNAASQNIYYGWFKVS